MADRSAMKRSSGLVYGIIRQGKMIMELSAAELENRARVFVSLKTRDMQGAKKVLLRQFPDVREEDG